MTVLNTIFQIFNSLSKRKKQHKRKVCSQQLTRLVFAVSFKENNKKSLLKLPRKDVIYEGVLTLKAFHKTCMRN